MSVPIVAPLRAEWRRWKSQASGRPPRRRTASCRPQVEGLEDRALLAPITEIPIPGGKQYPYTPPGEIVEGPDGNLWFINVDTGSIDSVTPSGKFNAYPIPDGGGLNAITSGPEGALGSPRGDWSAASRRVARSPSFRSTPSQGSTAVVTVGL